MYVCPVKTHLTMNTSAFNREQSLKKFRMSEIRNIFNTFLHNESAGGIVLIACTALAIIAANFGPMTGFNAIWDKEMGFTIGNFSLSMSLLHWVNDGLMAIFFFVVGLEIKREMMVGELSSIKHAALPVFAAIGGIIAPVLGNLGDKFGLDATMLAVVCLTGLSALLSFVVPIVNRPVKEKITA